MYTLHNCNYGNRCVHSHLYELTAEQTEALRVAVKRMACTSVHKPDREPCKFGDECLYGHECPDGANCHRRDCRFAADGCHPPRHSPAAVFRGRGAARGSGRGFTGRYVSAASRGSGWGRGGHAATATEPNWEDAAEPDGNGASAAASEEGGADGW